MPRTVPAQDMGPRVAELKATFKKRLLQPPQVFGGGDDDALLTTMLTMADDMRWISAHEAALNTALRKFNRAFQTFTVCEDTDDKELSDEVKAIISDCSEARGIVDMHAIDNMQRLMRGVAVNMSTNAKTHGLVHHRFEEHALKVMQGVMANVAKTPFGNQWKLFAAICGLAHDVVFTRKRRIDEEASAEWLISTLDPFLRTLPAEEQLAFANAIRCTIKSTIPVFVKAQTGEDEEEEDDNRVFVDDLHHWVFTFHEGLASEEERPAKLTHQLARVCELLGRADLHGPRKQSNGIKVRAFHVGCHHSFGPALGAIFEAVIDDPDTAYEGRRSRTSDSPRDGTPTSRQRRIRGSITPIERSSKLKSYLETVGKAVVLQESFDTMRISIRMVCEGFSTAKAAHQTAMTAYIDGGKWTDLNEETLTAAAEAIHKETSFMDMVLNSEKSDRAAACALYQCFLDSLHKQLTDEHAPLHKRNQLLREILNVAKQSDGFIMDMRHFLWDTLCHLSHYTSCFYSVFACIYPAPTLVSTDMPASRAPARSGAGAPPPGVADMSAVAEASVAESDGLAGSERYQATVAAAVASASVRGGATARKAAGALTVNTSVAQTGKRANF